MLFALDQLDAAGQTLALGGWIGGVLGLASTLITGYLSYRLSRDRLQFDADVLALKGRVKELERDVVEAKHAEERAVEAEARCRAELAELRSELREQREYLMRHGMPQHQPPAA